jgi:TRAP-type mannitol/chloroaromatic compound transport system substrate-binding protein
MDFLATAGPHGYVVISGQTIRPIGEFDMIDVRGKGGAVLGAMALSLVAGSAVAQEFSWKAQSLYPPGSEIHKQFEEFAENVKIASGGRLVIEALPVGTLVPQADAMDALQAGLLDMAAGTMSYQGGKEPAGALFDFTGGYNDIWEVVAFLNMGGGKEAFQEVADRWNVQLVGFVPIGMESIPTKTPIHNIHEFEGVKMRAPDGLPAQMFTKFGANVSVLPGTEVYTALDTGKIEATDWATLSVNDEAGYDRIAPYAIYPGIHTANGMDIEVAKPKWDALPPDLQKIVELAVAQWAIQSYTAQMVADAERVAARDPETLVTWGPAERRELRDVVQDIWAEWGAKSPLAQNVYDANIAFMKRIGNLRD